MLENQGGVCAICGGCEDDEHQERRFAVDHCHKTGKVRALLCFRCNVLLGAYENAQEMAGLFDEYIAEHG